MNRRIWTAAAGLAVGALTAALIRHLGDADPASTANPPQIEITQPGVLQSGLRWTVKRAGRGSWGLGLTSYDRLPTPPDAGCPELYEWAREHGAVATGDTVHSVVVRAVGASTQLRLLSIRARLIAFSKGSVRMSVSCTPPGTPGLTPQEHFALTEADDYLEVGIKGEDTLDLRKTRPWVQESSLEPSSTSDWKITVAKPPGMGDASYVLDITYLHQGRQSTVTIDDAGRPFTLAALDHGMGYIPPKLVYVRTPAPRWDYTPAICTPSPCHNPEAGP